MTSTATISSSQRSSQSGAVIQLQPLALPPLAAAQFLSISKRSLSRLIAAGKIVWSMLNH
jgi:hypothetical protein